MLFRIFNISNKAKPTKLLQLNLIVNLQHTQQDTLSSNMRFSNSTLIYCLK